MKSKIKYSHTRRVLFAALICFLFPVTVHAEKSSGSITVRPEHSESEMKFAVYRIADYEDGQYTILPEYDFSDGNIDLNSIENASQSKEYAKKLAGWTEKNTLPAKWQKCTENGVMTLDKAPLGMYLIVQVRHEADDVMVAPYLIGVPYRQEKTKELVYEVVSIPKGENVEKPEPPKPEPPRPEVTVDKDVKTGDPMVEAMYMHMIGLAVSAVGILLAIHYRKKQQGGE